MSEVSSCLSKFLISLDRWSFWGVSWRCLHSLKKKNMLKLWSGKLVTSLWTTVLEKKKEVSLDVKIPSWTSVFWNFCTWTNLHNTSTKMVSLKLNEMFEPYKVYVKSPEGKWILIFICSCSISSGTFCNFLTTVTQFKDHKLWTNTCISLWTSKLFLSPCPELHISCQHISSLINKAGRLVMTWQNTGTYSGCIKLHIRIRGV